LNVAPQRSASADDFCIEGAILRDCGCRLQVLGRTEAGRRRCAPRRAMPSAISICGFVEREKPDGEEGTL